MSRRAQIAMTDEEVWEFLAEPSHLATMATLRPDGSPHLVTVGYVVMDGVLTVISYKRTQKVANLQRDPRVSLLVESGGPYAERRGVQINGQVRFSDELPLLYRAFEILAVQYPVIVDSDVREAARRTAEPVNGDSSKRIAIIVEPRSIVTWDHRKLNGAY